MPSKQQVITEIQQWIIANGNNEITADVLRPILESMVDQINDLTGVLTDLSTTDRSTLVAAINSVKQQIEQSDIQVLEGSSNPNTTPPPSYSIGDFYIWNDGVLQGLFQWNGDTWTKVTSSGNLQVNQVFIGNVPTAGDDTTDAEIVAHVNATGFEILDNTLTILAMSTSVEGIPNVFTSFFFTDNQTTGTWGTASDNGVITESQLIINQKTRDIDLLTDNGVVIELGDIVSSTVEDYLNANVEPTGGAWYLDADVLYFFKYTKDGDVYVDLWVGTQPIQLGSNGTPATVNDFKNISINDLTAVTKDYVDTADNNTLIAAQNYVNNLLSGLKPEENEYADITALIADQANQTQGYLQFVADAGGFSNIDSGSYAYVVYLGTLNGNETDYRIIQSSDYYSQSQVDQLIADAVTDAVNMSNAYTDEQFQLANTRVVSFNAYYDTGMTYQVVASWYFEGVYFTTGGQPVPITLSNGDPTNPRIDVIAMDDTGNIVKLEGAPDVNPSKPATDPATQLEGTFILVEAGATAPTGVTKTLIYDENVGTGSGEWNATQNTGGARIVTNGNTNPYQGTLHIKATSVRKNDYVQLTAGALIPVVDMTQVSFRLRNISGSGISNSPMTIVIQGQDSGGLAVSHTITNLSNYGFSAANVASYQFIAFPVPQSSAMVNVSGIRIIVNEANNVNWTFNLDLVEATKGTAPPTTQGVTKEYVDFRDQTILQLAKDYADSLVIGGGDKNFIFNQGTPSASWSITHNLNKHPSVTVKDTGGNQVEGHVNYVNLDNVVVSFNAAFTGEATLN